MGAPRRARFRGELGAGRSVAERSKFQENLHLSRSSSPLAFREAWLRLQRILQDHKQPGLRLRKFFLCVGCPLFRFSSQSFRFLVNQLESIIEPSNLLRIGGLICNRSEESPLTIQHNHKTNCWKSMSRIPTNLVGILNKMIEQKVIWTDLV